MAAHRIKVLTYNIHKGFSTANFTFALREIRAKIESTRADVVFLQEIQGLHVRRAARVKSWPAASQFEYLAANLWPHHAYGKNAIYKAGHHGNAILSRFPFHSWENINVSRYRRASRGILHGVLLLPPDDRPLHTLCIHFDFIPRQRRQQIEVLLRRLASHIPRDEPLIVAGDFNDWEGAVSDGLKPRSGLVEIFEALKGRSARTFPAWLPALPLDRIYFRGIEPLACHSVKDHPAPRLSDHLALYAEFRLADARSPRRAPHRHASP
jgi:endonuclease/exonuclease/phosphatase family metal-dependent hydrolase